jgi:ElaB/YqjD/DUF883 family membrane-anchored ribosome-binding protein
MNTERSSEGRPLRQLTETLQTDIDMFKSTATDFERQIRRFVDERPVAAVMSALGVGFVLARIFSRR